MSCPHTSITRGPDEAGGVIDIMHALGYRHAVHFEECRQCGARRRVVEAGGETVRCSEWQGSYARRAALLDEAREQLEKVRAHARSGFGRMEVQNRDGRTAVVEVDEDGQLIVSSNVEPSELDRVLACVPELLRLASVLRVAIDNLEAISKSARPLEVAPHLN